MKTQICGGCFTRTCACTRVSFFERCDRLLNGGNCTVCLYRLRRRLLFMILCTSEEAEAEMKPRQTALYRKEQVVHTKKCSLMLVFFSTSFLKIDFVFHRVEKEMWQKCPIDVCLTHL